MSAKVAEFKRDHHWNLEVLRPIAAEACAEASDEGEMEQMLTTGKIVLSDIMSDAAIPKSMKKKEGDTVTAYERAASIRTPSTSPRRSL